MKTLIFISVMLTLSISSYAQQVSLSGKGNSLKGALYSGNTFTVNDSAESRKIVKLSVGGGIGVLGSYYLTSLSFIPEFNPYFKVSTGVNFFFYGSDTRAALLGLNVTPYLTLRPGKHSSFDIGTGLTYWRNKIAITPSLKFDTQMSKNTYIGAEIKYPIFLGSDYTFLPFLIVNLSFDL